VQPESGDLTSGKKRPRESGISGLEQLSKDFLLRILMGVGPAKKNGSVLPGKKSTYFCKKFSGKWGLAREKLERYAFCTTKEGGDIGPKRREKNDRTAETS